MSVERITFAIVGALIMATVGAYLASQTVYFLYGTAFVGFMVFQAGLHRILSRADAIENGWRTNRQGVRLRESAYIG